MGTKTSAKESNRGDVAKLLRSCLGGDTGTVEPAHFGQLLGNISVGFGTVIVQTNDKRWLGGNLSISLQTLVCPPSHVTCRSCPSIPKKLLLYSSKVSKRC